jgi:hypothetical protein
VKCAGKPNWTPPGLEVESVVVGVETECQVGGTSPGEQVIRARNYSLMSYDISIQSKCMSSRIHYLEQMEASPEGKVWEGSFTVPFSLDHEGRRASESQELAKVKDSPSAENQNISINLTAAPRGATGKYYLPEFIIQVDVAE